MKAEPGVYTLKGQDVDLVYISYPEKLLATAKDLIGKGEFSIAVVVAHMACEVSVERAISRGFESKGIDYLQRSIDELLPSYNIANDKVKDLYNALTGSKIQDQPFWQQFKESATRRNKAVHESKIATKAEGEDSFNAARKLVEYLK
ncbi:MAG: zinc ribbon domain-containing protein [Deltaproteobacteria bacterium]|nr:zinc ribbon domain-containing protein [Deltaproteobacteria bacterium]